MSSHWSIFPPHSRQLCAVPSCFFFFLFFCFFSLFFSFTENPPLLSLLLFFFFFRKGLYVILSLKIRGRDVSSKESLQYHYFLIPMATDGALFFLFVFLFPFALWHDISQKRKDGSGSSFRRSLRTRLAQKSPLPILFNSISMYSTWYAPKGLDLFLTLSTCCLCF